MVYLNLGDLWVNKVGVGLLEKLDLTNRNNTQVQLYRFGIDGLSWAPKMSLVGWTDEQKDSVFISCQRKEGQNYDDMTNPPV